MPKKRKIVGWLTVVFAVPMIVLFIVAFSSNLIGVPPAALFLAVVFLFLAVVFYDRWKNMKG